MPGFSVLPHLPELAQTHVGWFSDTIQPSCPLSSPSPPAFNLSQHHFPNRAFLFQGPGLTSPLLPLHQEQDSTGPRTSHLPGGTVSQLGSKSLHTAGLHKTGLLAVFSAVLCG